MHSKIAIVGDGIAGRLLYSLLKQRDIEVHLYGKKEQTSCGARSCGWGTSGAGIRFFKSLGIPVNILRRDAVVYCNGRGIRGELYVIDKPQLLDDLARDIRYDYPLLGRYDFIVDATGFKRVFSPPVSSDKVATNYQYRVISRERVEPALDFIRSGYLWTIPLGHYEAHVGGGSTILPHDKIKSLVLQRVGKQEILCSCSEPIRLSGLILPLINNGIITVGESAGLVIPLGGGGIHTAAESALILAKALDKGNIMEYNRTIKRKFGWLRNARKVLDRIEQGNISIFDLLITYRALRYQGIKPTFGDLLHVKKKLEDKEKK